MFKPFFRRCLCLLAAVLTLSLAIPAVPAAQSGETAVIRTVSDLLELVKDCTLDTWSQGRTVELEADLDLSGGGFTPIPTFGGAFRGNGHIISGLSITADGSHQGLFRYLQPGGLVENLNVRGTVTPGGSAGQVGGIVGANETTGRVTGCTSTASVSAADQQDTGGIAGYSTGVIQSCANSGSVGYAHVGYNVGGIAGQSEPDVLISDNKVLSDIRAASDRLSGLVDQAISHADFSAGDISARLSEIGSRAGSARDNAQDLLDRTGDLLNTNIDAVNDLSVTLTGALDRISPAMGGLSDAAGKLAELTEELRLVMNLLAAASGGGRQLAADLDRGMDSLQTAVRRARTAIEQMKDTLGSLRSAVVGGDAAGADRALADLSNGAAELSEALRGVSDAQEKLAGGLSGDADLALLREALQDMAESIKKAGAAAGTISGALSGLKDFDFQFGDLSTALRGLSGAMGTLSGAADSLQTALDQLRRSAGDASEMGGALQSALRQLGDLSGDAGQAAGLLSSSVDKIKNAVDYLRQTGPITLTGADDAYRAAGDRLFDDLTGVSSALKNLNDSVTSASDTLLADLRAINRQFNLVMDLVIDAIIGLQDGVEDDRRVRDTSEENAAAQTRGKVDQCANSGLVEGDRNVGGVTGKKDCVGGVVGRMDLGFLSACQNYGDAKGESYVGGIAGRMASTLEKSYAKCSLSGKNFVGGIAGCGGTVRRCAAIRLISGAAECLGAVAGYADKLDDITENYYIDTGAGGVDGVSYAGHAQGAELSFLQDLEGAPAEFTAFRLILRADGHVLRTIPFTFGQRLSRVELPDPPEKAGFFGVWPALEDDTPRSDVILDAEYSPWLTVISSSQADGDRPLALADGQFTSQAELTVSDSARRAPAGASPEADVWDVTLTGADLEEDTVLSLRLLCPGGGTVRVFRNGGWQGLDAQANGSYSQRSRESVKFGE